MNSPPVQKRAVPAAKIDEPKLADILQVNKRVPPRHFGRLQHDCVSHGSSYRTTAFDRMAFTVGRFQPGTFLWGRVHGEALSKITTDGKYLPSTPDCRRGCIRVTAEGSFRRALAFGKGSFILDIAWQRVYKNLVAR